ncbi:MAG TPA: sodium bicarbonate transporter family protein [Polyangiaceae bacterium LLY-WYZ-15_(1-7)]|nr:sodium bicarbonate transporter family protein [Polyangiaceae bacterium LLY-WYZ-15_(1-7)]
MPTHKTLHESEVVLDVAETELPALVRLSLDLWEEHHALPAAQRAAIEQRIASGALALPEDLGHGVGVLRVAHAGEGEAHCALLRLEGRIPARDRAELHFLWIVAGPDRVEDPTDEELEPFGWMLVDDRFSGDAFGATTEDQLLEVYERYLEFVETPPSISFDDVPPELSPSGKLFGGLLKDVRRRGKVYASDFTDGLHPKTLASVFYLFFALLAPAVAFGGLSAEFTGDQIGAVETIVGTAVLGFVYAFLSGQPLTVIGSVGPVVVFIGILYSLCESLGIPFLPSYAWVGLWTAVILLVLAATEASNLIRYFTRFTDEIFAGLMSLIFIVEAIKDIAAAFAGDASYATALLSLVLALGTYYVASSLARLRHSKLLRWWARDFLADFGPAIAIICMTAVAFVLHPVELEKLAVPAEFGTTSGRPWLVNPLDAPTWVWFASIGPALLIATLLFFDQNITTRLVASPDHRLEKGSGFHLDIAVIGLCTAVASLFGLPWMVAATVRSLATIETHGGSEVIASVRETRLTGVLVHLLMGASLFFLPALSQVPMSVLFGLFLFMGFASMRSNQMFERLGLWLTDPNMYPPTHYLRRVPRKVVHVFTFVQAACLGVLWLVKVSAIGLAFPLFIALLVPLRLAMRRWFEPAHLAWLDAAEVPSEEDMRVLE